MRPKRHEPRKGREIKRPKFTLTQEQIRLTKKYGFARATQGGQGVESCVPVKAFGTNQGVSGTTFLGSTIANRKIAHWHVDRRKKQGTVADRKK